MQPQKIVLTEEELKNLDEFSKFFIKNYNKIYEEELAKQKAK